MSSRGKIVVLTGAVILLFTAVVALGVGAVDIGPLNVIDILLHQFGGSINGQFTTSEESVLLTLRLPRILLALLVGAGLSIAGASLQGLFRNPLADPGLIGVSAGASLSAALLIVWGSAWAVSYFLPFGTFLGAALTAFLVYSVSRQNGQIQVSTLLLAGIAINALAMAMVGFLTYTANESQLRDLTFWTLGSLGGASWTLLAVSAPFILLPILVLPLYAKSLNTFALGENNAMALGVNARRFKRMIIVWSALAVGACVAVSGIIVFVGLVIPHIVRLLTGPDHRSVLLGSSVLGAIVLLWADMLSRKMIEPTELPIGVVTAFVGAPIFLSILIREKRKFAVH